MVSSFSNTKLLGASNALALRVFHICFLLLVLPAEGINFQLFFEFPWPRAEKQLHLPVRDLLKI